ncbi:putative protein TPRXL [Pristis pectinata]|uniref:putative protein TPRXL n=1 Tax=Pristis pectinata TaxID=685728 RepID=UPI00223D1589|nr:putative protein TPRXL [Pristis pectinata]
MCAASPGSTRTCWRSTGGSTQGKSHLTVPSAARASPNHPASSSTSAPTPGRSRSNVPSTGRDSPSPWASFSTSAPTPGRSPSPAPSVGRASPSCPTPAAPAGPHQRAALHLPECGKGFTCWSTRPSTPERGPSPAPTAEKAADQLQGSFNLYTEASLFLNTPHHHLSVIKKGARKGVSDPGIGRSPSYVVSSAFT